MALIDNKRQRAGVLAALFFAQGLPRGFMAIAMITYLAERGISDAEAGRLSAIILLPWALRIVWAPLLDAVWFKSMGRRRPWIIGAELMMAVSLLGLLTLGDALKSLTLISALFFLHNSFAALQDVATEALAIDILPNEELGTMNGLMIGAKVMGRGLGAAGLASIMNRWGPKTAVMVQFGVLLAIMLFPLLTVERPGERRLPWSRGRATPLSSRPAVLSPLAVLKDLCRAFWLRTTAALFLFGLVASIGEEIVDLITKPFYTKELGWTFVQYSSVAGAAVALQVIGSLVGGWTTDRFGRRITMALGTGVYGLIAIIFGTFSGLWPTRWFPAGLLILGPAASAFGGVAFFAMAMRVSWTRSAVSVFTTLITVAAFGHVIGDSLIGTLRERLAMSYQAVFWAGGLIMLIALVLLPAVTPEQVDTLKKTDGLVRGHAISA